MNEYSPSEVDDVVCVFRKIASTTFPAGSDVIVGIGKLDEAMAQCEKVSGEKISANIARGVLVGALEHEPELRAHLFRNMARLPTYTDVKREIISALSAQRSVTQAAPMDIGALNGGKRGRGRGKSTGAGPKGRGESTSAASSSAAGPCFHCGKPGHKKAECRKWLAEQKQSGHGSKNVAGKGLKGRKGKSKGEAKNGQQVAAMQVQTPTAESQGASNPAAAMRSLTLDSPPALSPEFIFSPKTTQGLHRQCIHP